MSKGVAKKTLQLDKRVENLQHRKGQRGSIYILHQVTTKELVLVKNKKNQPNNDSTQKPIVGEFLNALKDLTTLNKQYVGPKCNNVGHTKCVKTSTQNISISSLILPSFHSQLNFPFPYKNSIYWVRYRTIMPLFMKFESL